jgi:hypothetical protein
MSETESVILRDDIVSMTRKLLILLGNIGYIVYRYDMEQLLIYTYTIPDMDELIQHPDQLRVFHEYLSNIRSWLRGIFVNTSAALSELESLKKQLSKLLDDLDTKVNALSSEIKALKGISSIG